MKKKQKWNSINQLSDLRKLLETSDEWRQKNVYPFLKVGDVWWIPDEITNFGNRQKHPWIVITPYRHTMPNVTIAPRTTSFRKNDKSRGVITPAGIPPGLDMEGLFLLDLLRTFPIEKFVYCDYVNQLDTHYVQLIKEYIRDNII